MKEKIKIRSVSGITTFNEPIDTYISSTDKNVGAESLLIDSPFIINGTGIRPHMALFKENKRFFDEESFNYNLSDKGSPINDKSSPNKMKFDTTKTITTNKGLANITTIYNELKQKYTKLVPYLSKKCFVTEKEPNTLLTQKDINKLIDDDENINLINLLDDDYNNNTFNLIMTPLYDTSGTIFTDKGKEDIKTFVQDISNNSDDTYIMKKND